jgi:hypothetical protein
MLHVTADNGYTVWINDNKIGDAQVSPGWETSNLTDTYLEPRGWETVEEYSTEGVDSAIDIDWLNKGNNTIMVLAGNEQMDGGSATKNPAGLIYELYIEYGEHCKYCCEEDQGGEG